MLEVIATKINYKEIYNLVKNLPTGKNVLTKPRGDFFYDPHILNEEYKGTEIEKLLDLIPMHGEARVIVMEPGQSYSAHADICLLYTSPSPRDRQKCRMPSSA